MVNNSFDVIIIGGSYAGLSAAMALGRSLRNVLVIDSADPCNKQTPHSHNFITHDGETPAAINLKAKEQLAKYDTVKFKAGLATKAIKIENEFEVLIDTGEIFNCKKILFATGVKDEMPAIPGFAACWGISVLHCPYCHGYEVKNEKIAVLANGDIGYEFAKLISNWTQQLTLLTNGKSILTNEQTQKLAQHNISIIEKEIVSIEHENGRVDQVIFKDNSNVKLSAMFARASFKQHCNIPEVLGCVITETGHLQVDDFNKTSISSVFAAGDNTTMFRSVANAVAAGNKSGAIINKELIDDSF